MCFARGSIVNSSFSPGRARIYQDGQKSKVKKERKKRIVKTYDLIEIKINYLNVTPDREAEEKITEIIMLIRKIIIIIIK